MVVTDDEIKRVKQYNKIGIKDLLGFVETTSNEKTEIISNFNIFDMCNWVVWKNMWIKDKNGSPKVKDIYHRRKLVLVELGASNIDSEASYNHPAVIIYNNVDWVVIAPITSKRYGKGIDFLIDIPQGACSLKENSSVQVDHIRCISKKRITGTLSGSLPVGYMNKVNMVILQKYIYPVYQDYVTTKDLNKLLDEDNKSLKEEISVLKKYESGDIKEKKLS